MAWPLTTHNSIAPINVTSNIIQNPTAVIPTLADRLETYRQMTASRTINQAAVITSTCANTIVSQSPMAGHYTTSLVERTRDLRNWLRQAKNEHEILRNGISGIGQQTDL
jgi:centrosomal protein CEP164